METEPEYIVYYKTLSKDFRTYNSSTTEFETMKRLPTTISNFYILKKYENNDEDLKRFSKDIKIASEQIKTKIPFDYIKPFVTKEGKTLIRTHFKNIETFFNYNCKNEKTGEYLYKDFEHITYQEYVWMNKTYNGGLQYTKTGTYQSYGYDFSNYYGDILGVKTKMAFKHEFKIPTKPGKEMKLKKIPESIKFGYYNVVVKSENETFNKIFAYSEDDVYTSNDLEFIKICKKTMNISVELNMDCEKNAYIYNLDSLISPHLIFQKWFDKIIELKKAFPKNMLLKCLSSTLWGTLSRSNTKRVSEEEADKMSIGITEKAEYYLKDEIHCSDGSIFYKVVPTKRPFFHPFRLKSFITSYGRTKIAYIALRDIENVIKIQTDSIAYDKEIKHEISSLIVDPKTTGYIKFVNNRDFKKVDKY